MSAKTNIEICEQRLKQAMLNSDIAELNTLLSDDLIFTNHLGVLMSKKDDLEMHGSGKLKIEDIKFSDFRIQQINNEVVVVTAQSWIRGYFNNSKSEEHFRFTRVWHKLSEDRWQVVTAHACVVCESYPLI